METKIVKRIKALELQASGKESEKELDPFNYITVRIGYLQY